MKMTIKIEVEVDIQGGHRVNEDCLRGVAYRALKDAVEFRGKEGFEHDLACTPTLKMSGFYVDQRVRPSH